MKLKIAMCAALLICGCVADKAPQPAAPSRASSQPMIARQQQEPAAKVEITSAAGEIHIGQLHIGKSSQPLLAQCVSPSSPAAGSGRRAEGAGMADREAEHEADAGDRPYTGVVIEPEERTDAVPARPKLLRLK